MGSLEGIVSSVVLPLLSKWCKRSPLVSLGWERGATEENKGLLAQLPCSSVSTDLEGGVVIYSRVLNCSKINGSERYVQPRALSTRTWYSKYDQNGVGFNLSRRMFYMGPHNLLLLHNHYTEE